ncbi:hypothetical protein [Staphylococcus epidermidis]|nr:hypothetical protein [Staphylococcus epidermidis]
MCDDGMMMMGGGGGGVGMGMSLEELNIKDVVIVEKGRMGD